MDPVTTNHTPPTTNHEPLTTNLQPLTTNRFKLAAIGPGLLLAATGIGVGDMVSSTIAGAEYGLTLVWGLAAGVVLKFAITEGAARWQLGTGDTLIEAWRDHLPRAAVFAFFIYFII